MTKAEIQQKIKDTEAQRDKLSAIVTGDDFDPSNAADKKAQADYEAALKDLGKLEVELAQADAAEQKEAFNKAADAAVTTEFNQRGWSVVDKNGKNTAEFLTFRQEVQKIIQSRGGKITAEDAANVASSAAVTAAARIAQGDIVKPEADDDKGKRQREGRRRRRQRQGQGEGEGEGQRQGRGRHRRGRQQ